MNSAFIRFDVFTLFPEVFEPYLETSILQRARQRGLVEVQIHNIRDWTTDRHHITDDEPYGGGGGMVMKPEPLFAAVEAVLGSPPTCPVVLLSPQGTLFTQELARRIAFGESPHSEATVPDAPRQLGLICGRYEGVDERVREHLATLELSIGDYVITGGELAALVVIDAVTRWIPGVLGDPDGTLDDLHASGLLEYPHYTRPPEFRGWGVPEVLVSGDHARIARWRREQSLQRTWARRRDMLDRAELSQADLKYIEILKKTNPDFQE